MAQFEFQVPTQLWVKSTHVGLATSFRHFEGDGAASVQSSGSMKVLCSCVFTPGT